MVKYVVMVAEGVPAVDIVRKMKEEEVDSGKIQEFQIIFGLEIREEEKARKSSGAEAAEDPAVPEGADSKDKGKMSEDDITAILRGSVDPNELAPYSTSIADGKDMSPRSRARHLMGMLEGGGPMKVEKKKKKEEEGSDLEDDALLDEDYDDDEFEEFDEYDNYGMGGGDVFGSNFFNSAERYRGGSNYGVGNEPAGSYGRSTLLKASDDIVMGARCCDAGIEEEAGEGGG